MDERLHIPCFVDPRVDCSRTCPIRTSAEELIFKQAASQKVSVIKAVEDLRDVFQELPEMIVKTHIAQGKSDLENKGLICEVVGNLPTNS